jgi:hypothetical protein
MDELDRQFAGSARLIKTVEGEVRRLLANSDGSA